MRRLNLAKIGHFLFFLAQRHYFEFVILGVCRYWYNAAPLH